MLIGIALFFLVIAALSLAYLTWLVNCWRKNDEAARAEKTSIKERIIT